MSKTNVIYQKIQVTFILQCFANFCLLRTFVTLKQLSIKPDVQETYLKVMNSNILKCHLMNLGVALHA